MPLKDLLELLKEAYGTCKEMPETKAKVALREAFVYLSCQKQEMKELANLGILSINEARLAYGLPAIHSFDETGNGTDFDKPYVPPKG